METAVTVYGPVRSATGKKTVTLEWAGGTVADAIGAIVESYPRAEPHIYDGEEIRASVRVSIDGERAGVEDRVPEGASLSLVPAVQGGSGAEPGLGGENRVLRINDIPPGIVSGGSHRSDTR